MDIQILTDFFMWCTIINMGMLCVASIAIVLFADSVYCLHNKFFPLERKAHTAILFSFLAVYKVLIFVFNIVPYIALLIVV